MPVAPSSTTISSIVVYAAGKTLDILEPHKHAGRVARLKPPHPLKAPLPTYATLAGIVMFFMPLQPLNAPSPIVHMPFGNSTLVNPPHPLNA